MSAVADYFNDLGGELGSGWNRFWFTPASPLPLARMRMATGLLVFAWFLSWLGHQDRFLAEDGLLPPEMVQQLLQDQNRHLYRPSPLFNTATHGGLLAYNLLGLTAAALFTAGVLSRFSGALTLVMMLGYIHRAPMLTGPAETILVMLLLYLTFAPSSAALSFDAWLAERRGKSLANDSWLANVGLRLVQVHLAILVLLVACSQLASDVWWDGTAIWTLQAQELSRPLNLAWLHRLPKLVNGWTHLFVLVNLLFPVLVWYRIWRPLVLTMMALLWLLMIPITGQTLYILGVLIALYAFVPPRLALPQSQSAA